MVELNINLRFEIDDVALKKATTAQEIKKFWHKQSHLKLLLRRLTAITNLKTN